MNEKIIFSDIDDTLLSKGESLENLQSFVEGLKKLNFQLVFATARPISSFLQLPWLSSIKGIIPYNGLCYYDVSTGNTENIVLLQDLDKLPTGMNWVCLAPQETIYVSNQDQIPYLKQSDSFRRIENLVDQCSQPHPSMLTLAFGRKDTDKIPTIDPEKWQIKEYPETRFGNDISWIDVTPKDMNKAIQVNYLVGKSKPSLSLALGNGWNDVEMLQTVDLSFSPADSDEEAKEVATSVLMENGGRKFRDAIIGKLTNEDVHIYIS